MADVLIQKYVGDPRHHSGKIVNVYGSYANALSHGSTGLTSGVKDVDRTDGTAGDTISQVAKTTGIEIDQFGMIHFFVDDASAVFLMSDGHWGPPRRIVPA